MKPPKYIPEKMGDKKFADNYGKEMLKYRKWEAEQEITEPRNLEELIEKELISIEKLKKKKRDIDKLIDIHIENIGKYRQRENQ